MTYATVFPHTLSEKRNIPNALKLTRNDLVPYKRYQEIPPKTNESNLNKRLQNTRELV